MPPASTTTHADIQYDKKCLGVCNTVKRGIDRALLITLDFLKLLQQASQVSSFNTCKKRYYALYYNKYNTQNRTSLTINCTG